MTDKETIIQLKAKIHILEMEQSDLRSCFADLNERHANTCANFKKLTDSVIKMADNVNVGFTGLSLRVDVIQDSLTSFNNIGEIK